MTSIIRNIFCIFIFLSSVYANGIEDRTIGGKYIDDSKKAKPWLVKIVKENSGCSGSLISSKFVLSAFHCIQSAELSEFSFKSKGSDKVVKATNVYLPEQDKLLYTKYDIVLIELSEPIELSYYAKLPKADTIDAYYGKQDASILYGYGVHDLVSEQELLQQIVGNTLKPTELVLSIMDRQTCNTKLKNDFLDPKYFNNFICADNIQDAKRRGKPIGMCAGDSGGPLVVEDRGEHIQIGVVNGYLEDSKELDCGYNTGKYSNVSHYASWIKSVLENTPKPSDYEVFDLLGQTDSVEAFYSSLSYMPPRTFALFGLGLNKSIALEPFILDAKRIDIRKKGFKIYTYNPIKKQFVSFTQKSEKIIINSLEGFWIVVF